MSASPAEAGTTILPGVVQFKQDARKDQKLKGLKETGTWEQTDYVKKQGWATMPGEREPDSKVAGECVKLLLLIS